MVHMHPGGGDGAGGAAVGAGGADNGPEAAAVDGTFNVMCRMG